MVIKIIISVIAVILLFALGLLGIFIAGLINFNKVGNGKQTEKTNPHITKDGETLVAAHRSGAGIAPENTLMAFQHCLGSKDFYVDIYEFDLDFDGAYENGLFAISADKICAVTEERYLRSYRYRNLLYFDLCKD